MYATRTQIWETLNETERRVRYYRELRRRYDRRYNYSRGLMLFFCMSGIVSLLDKLPNYIGIAISVGLCIIIVADYTIRYGEKAATFALLEKESRRIREHSKRLWSERASAEREVQQRYKDISEQLLSLDDSDLFSMLPESKELAVKSEKEADKYMKAYTYA